MLLSRATEGVAAAVDGVAAAAAAAVAAASAGVLLTARRSSSRASSRSGRMTRVIGQLVPFSTPRSFLFPSHTDTRVV